VLGGAQLTTPKTSNLFFHHWVRPNGDGVLGDPDRRSRFRISSAGMYVLSGTCYR